MVSGGHSSFTALQDLLSAGGGVGPGKRNVLLSGPGEGTRTAGFGSGLLKAGVLLFLIAP